MKNKSSHHQDENTFKFQTFGERLANINIDVVRRLKKFSSTPQESDTFFGEALAKWTELNCTQHFVNFRLEISQEVQSFAQLIHHQDNIVNTLEKHLRVSGSLAIQPLLDLVVQLARDLQGDFYPYFDRFFAVIVALLNKCRHHVDVLEQAFTCLAYVFKFLWRLMVKDIHRVYKSNVSSLVAHLQCMRLFCPLLSSKYQEYINTFASESFAFLMRKVKDESELFEYMFSSLDETPDQVLGVGCLLFEMIKGVQKQFHSSTEEVLPRLLAKLGSDSLSHDMVLEALCHVWTLMADHTTPQHSLCVWRPLLSCLEVTRLQWQKVKVRARSGVSDHLTAQLRLLQVWVSYKDGLLVMDTVDEVVKSLLKLLRGDAIPDSSLVLDIVESLLLATRCPLAAHHRPSLINAIFSSSYCRKEIFSFTRRVFMLPLFEKDLLPAVLRYCHGCVVKADKDGGATSDVLYLLLAMLLDKMPGLPPSDMGEASTGYPLDFTSVINSGGTPTRKSRRSFPAWVVSELDRGQIETSELDTVWALLHCLPQLRPLDTAAALVSLTKLFGQLRTTLESQEDAADIREPVLFVLFECLSTLHQLSPPVTFYDTVSVAFITSIIRRWPASVPCLKAAHLYFTNASNVTIKELRSEETFRLIFEPMQENLSSPYSQVRLLTLQIFCQFTLPMPCLDESQGISQPGVFQICLDAECVALSVSTCREKLMHLRKLDVHVIVNQLPLGPYSQVALRYLLGMLRINFKMLWQPVMELVRSHADHMTREDFWEVFGNHLEMAAELSEKVLMRPKFQTRRHSMVTNTSQTEDACDSMMTFDLSELFGRHQVALMNRTEHPDFVNVRQLLWKTMLLFPAICEAKTRIISPLLFRFLDNEYRSADINEVQMQDVRRPQGDTVDLYLNDDDITEPTDKLDETSGGGQRRRASNKTLEVHLILFSKFKQPKSVFLEPKLTALYYDLLQHADGLVQKVAFDCIMTYSHKYLTPYRENFERLLDDKSFKNELVMFSIAEESSAILGEHRDGLIPVLMRLLYGKMQAKSGKDTSGHKHVQMRKNMILRFLAGSQPEEVRIFLDLVFQPFLHLVSDDVGAKVAELTRDIDLSQIIPIKKQQGVVSTIEVVLKKLGNLIESYLPNVLHILVCLAALCVHVLQQRHLVATPVVTSLKSLRVVIMTRINQFFLSFLDYPYSVSEVDAIFSALVWPQVTKLSFEGVYSPTSLLKIFVTWSSEPRYLPLLAKVKTTGDDGTEVSPLPFVFQLLLAKSVSPAVVDAIMTLVESLLVTEDFKATDEVKVIDAGAMVDLNRQGQDMSYGTMLLLPHVSVILQHLKGVVKTMALPSMGRKKTVPARELNILARLSEFVQDLCQSAELVRLLLPFLGRRLSRSLTVEVDVLTAVRHLITQVDAPKEFLPTIAHLFSTLSARTSRTQLCEVLKAIASKDSSLEVTAQVITKLNAWDVRRVDEPDYALRLDAFNQTRALLTQDSAAPDQTLLLVLTHNCVYFLATSDDLSLRDSASDCLKGMITRLAREGDVNAARQRALFHSVVLQNLLPEVKRNVKLKSEVARHEFIGVLAHLVRSFPQCELFSDLLLLTDQVDPEVDFFNNITHIQPHRRGRALRRLSKHLSVTHVKRDTLVSYLLPIVTAFVRDDCAAKHHTLVDAAVETIGVMCRCLPWPRYLLVLQYYLNQLPRSLDNQKLMVKIVVAVLESFHFDLQHSLGVCPAANKNKSAELEKEEPTAQDSDNGKVGKPLSGEQPLEAEGAAFESEGAALEEGDMTKELAEEEEESRTDEPVLTPGATVVCTEGMATRIHRVIVKSILPLLHKCLTHKTKSDDEHKLAKPTKYAEDEEILRVPIALAMVKLLQSLPKNTLQRNLPGILLKVCHFLQSRAQDIRDTSRDTLVKIVQSLGPSYFSFVLKELRSSLQRGYQRHILSYTVWSLLRKMSGQLKPGDLDPCIPSLTEVFNEELFGEVGEEKEVQGIVSKLMEARSSKSYESYRLLARLASKTSLGPLVMPLKQVLESTHSHKRTKKVSDALHQMGQGLVDNDGLEVDALLTFVYALTKEVLPGLKASLKDANAGRKSLPDTLRPPSQLLLKPEPKRGGKKPKTHIKTNVSIIIEFGLQLLHLLLKKGLVGGVKVEHLQLLDPFISTLTVCIESKHVKVATASLRCLGWLLKFSLPALKKHVAKVTADLFVLLSNYAAAGAAKGENFELVVMCFKTMTVLVRDIKYHSISTEQLQVLLGYVEQDIHDHTRQATAFSLLKAILSRRLIITEIEDVLAKVEQLSVTAESAHVRLQCRQVEMQFLLDYPLGKKLERHLEFYVAQLGYEYETGRESSLEMLAMIFSAFPLPLLSEYAGFFFIPLISRLTSDESAKCRRLTALAVKCLLGKLESSQRDKLFDMCVQWLQGTKATLKRVAALTCGLFVEVESGAFEHHLATLLPIIKDVIQPEKYDMCHETSVTEDRQLDLLLFNVITLLIKTCRECNIVRRQQWTSIMKSIWGHLERHLLHPHAWVRLASAQMFGILFGAWTVDEVIAVSSRDRATDTGDMSRDRATDTGDMSYIEDDIDSWVYTLCGAFCKQLTSPQLDTQLAEQIIKNTVFLAKLLKRLPSTTESNDITRSDGDECTPSDDVTKSEKKASLRWLMKRLCREVQMETAFNPKALIKRKSVFTWLAAVAVDLGKDELPSYLPLMMAPLVREFTSSKDDSELHILSQEVLDLLKGIVGVEIFTGVYATSLRALTDRRDTRKKQRATQAVSDPESAARRKIKKNLAKKEAKKRRIEELRPTKSSSCKKRTRKV